MRQSRFSILQTEQPNNCNNAADKVRKYCSASLGILIFFVNTSLLIMGTSVIPMQSYAGSASDDYKSKIKSRSQTVKKSTSQYMDQDSLCYRGNECQQGNEGQQIVAKDNDAAGFNDQSLNVLQSNPPTLTPTPTPKTCEECFTSNLNPSQLEVFEGLFGIYPFSEYC